MNTMNSLARSLIEKAGYDNGFEIAQKSDPSVVSLCSSLHPVRVDIAIGSHENAYVLRFPDAAIPQELKRGVSGGIFLNERIEVSGRELLGNVLKRAAELGFALPDGPMRFYNKELDKYFEKNQEERPGFSETAKSMFQGTERAQLVKQRIGQNVYRAALLKYWENGCAITGLDIQEMLRASHIKPWADCDNDSDRLNIYNGFLLAANYDALFDKGLITFDDTGRILYSRTLSKSQITAIGDDRYTSLRWIDERHIPFLEWHRRHIFTKGL